MKIILSALACTLLCSGVVQANPPRGFRVVPGVPAAAGLEMQGPKRDALVKAIQEIHGLNREEAAAVFFSRAAEALKESALTEELVREWAQIAQVEVSEETPEVVALSAEHDLDVIEAELVYLVRRTTRISETTFTQKALVLKYADELVKRAAEKNK